jgi:regulator of replication initiation timing
VSDSIETPQQRLARWTATDAALGIAAEAEQLEAKLAERDTEIGDLRARLVQLTNRVAQLEAENADLRRVASRVPFTSFARRIYRRARSVAARRLHR